MPLNNKSVNQHAAETYGKSWSRVQLNSDATTTHNQGIDNDVDHNK